MRSTTIAIIVALIGTSGAFADLGDWFTGFDTVSEIGVSGQRSSYHADTKDGLTISGDLTGNVLAELATERVSYPSGVGEVPSPGGNIGKFFDQGILGVMASNDELTLRIATGLDPRAGHYHNGWKTWYGQGDLFLNVLDSDGMSHFALLNDWARNDNGNLIDINRGHFEDAMDFRFNNNDNLVGHLIELGTDSDVMITGGRGAYHPGNAPAGLDMRGFARGGTDLGSANLSIETLEDLGQTWYVQTWTVGLGSLSSDAQFDIGLHAAASCGNDQIAMNYNVPEPGSLGLMLLGVAMAFRLRRAA